MSAPTRAGDEPIARQPRASLPALPARVAAGESMPGLIVTSKHQPVGAAIDDILMIAECASEIEMSELFAIFLPVH